MVAPKLQLGLLIWKQNVFQLRTFPTQKAMSNHRRDQVNSVLTLYQALSDFSSSSITLSEITEAVLHRAGEQHIRNNFLNDFLNLLEGQKSTWPVTAI